MNIFMFYRRVNRKDAVDRIRACILSAYEEGTNHIAARTGIIEARKEVPNVRV